LRLRDLAGHSTDNANAWVVFWLLEIGLMAAGRRLTGAGSARWTPGEDGPTMNYAEMTAMFFEAIVVALPGKRISDPGLAGSAVGRRYRQVAPAACLAVDREHRGGDDDGRAQPGRDARQIAENQVAQQRGP